jgi:hypothetical protein
MSKQSAKPGDPTLKEIAQSLTSMDGRLASLDSRLGSLECKVSSLDNKMVTKDEFKQSVDRLEATIKREAGDLGGSLHSLTNMVDGRFSGVNTRLDGLETSSGPSWRKHKLW